MRRAGGGRGRGEVIEASHHDDGCWPAIEVDTGSVLMLRSASRDCEGSGHREAWRSHVGVDRATTVFDWMSARPGDWPLWGRIATLFGEAALRPIVVDAAEKEVEQAAAAAEEARLEEADRIHRHREIDLYVLDHRNKRPALSLESGDEKKPFFVMRFSEKWERDRVLDWLRWQSPRFLEFREVFESEGSVALERLIIAGMREMEAKAKIQGLSSGGRRPLRFWRSEA